MLFLSLWKAFKGNLLTFSCLLYCRDIHSSIHYLKPLIIFRVTGGLDLIRADIGRQQGRFSVSYNRLCLNLEFPMLCFNPIGLIYSIRIESLYCAYNTKFDLVSSLLLKKHNHAEYYDTSCVGHFSCFSGYTVFSYKPALMSGIRLLQGWIIKLMRMNRAINKLKWDV